MKLSNKLTDAVVAFVASLALPCPATEAQVRHLMARLGDHAEGALLLGQVCHADTAMDYQKALQMLNVIQARGDCLTLRDLAVDGKMLMDELDLSGRRVGVMLEKLLDAVLDDPAQNERSALLSLAHALKNR